MSLSNHAETVLIRLRRLFRFVIRRTCPLLSYQRVCGLRRAGFDHGFSLRRDPEAVDRRLVPNWLTVFLHLEADLWAEAHAFSVASPSYFVGTKFYPPISTPSS